MLVHDWPGFHRDDGFLGVGSIIQGTKWSFRGVAFPLLFNREMRLCEVVESLANQRFVPETGVKALAAAVLPGCFRPDFGNIGTARRDPVPNGLRSDLRAVARTAPSSLPVASARISPHVATDARHVCRGSANPVSPPQMRQSGDTQHQTDLQGPPGRRSDGGGGMGVVANSRSKRATDLPIDRLDDAADYARIGRVGVGRCELAAVMVEVAPGLAGKFI